MIELPVDASAIPKSTIDWYRSTPWWRLASQSIVISWRATHLLLCSAALLATQAWTNLTHYCFNSDTESVGSWIAPVASPNMIAPQWSTLVPSSVLSVWQQYMAYVFRWLQSPTLNGAAECLASMIGIVGIWSLVGGCIARRSVVELGTNMTAPWGDAFRVVRKRWQSIAWSVTMPGALILLMSIGPLVIGWISNIPSIGMFVAGLLLVPTVFLSIGIGWCAAITVFGFPLSVCSVVTERQADAYDGVSRSAAYTFQRPLTLALCVIGTQALGTIGGSMLALVISTGFSVIEAGFSVGSYSSIAEMDSIWTKPLNGIVPLLLSAYSFSFFWTAAAVTYLILRRDVDHAEFDLIDMDVAGDPQPLPELPKKEISHSSTDNPGIPENTAE
jgi:hypothetical protein